MWFEGVEGVEGFEGFQGLHSVSSLRSVQCISVYLRGLRASVVKGLELELC